MALTAKGTYKVKKFEMAVPHDEGFRRALDIALKKTGWPAGHYANVKVEYSLEIDVVNPGNVTGYVVKLGG